MTMNRRDFLVSTAVMTAGATVKGLASPNDTVRMAVVGCGGRGQSHVSAWSSMPNVEIVALCDVDQFHINEKLKYLENKGAKKPVTYVDMRKMLEDKNIDAVSIATPNHWHALQTIWAVQAGKDVYVEKPCTHNIFESQQIVADARKYNRLVQQGSQSRSSPALREAVQRMRDGELGEVYMARVLCYKWRDTIGRYPDGPMKSGETFAFTVGGRPEPCYDSAYLSNVDYDLWLGPAAKRPFNRNRFHYNWHWFWDTGNGDLGNQGIHEMDIARWGLGKTEMPRAVQSSGGRFGYSDDGETPNTELVALEFDDCLLQFEVRGLPTNAEAGAKIGVLFYGTEGLLSITSYTDWQTYLGPKCDQKGPGGKGGGDHFANFVRAVKARD